MNKLTEKVSRRIMAAILSLAMIMSNMTVYASEYSVPAQQTEDTVENIETDAAELSSTEDETVQDDAAQEETADDETSQEGTEGDKQETETSGESSGSGNVEGDDAVSEGNESDIDDETSEAVATLEEDAEVSDNIEAEEPNNDEGSKPTLWIVGDSTVCSFSDAYYYPRYGYGTQIENYLKKDSYNIQNLALSGRSSKSFITDEKSNNYDTLKNGIKSGDTLVIGFGHNDSKNEQDRYTNPNGDYKTAGSFANCLYDNYVKMATDKGAEVIICTPIVRRNPKADTLTNDNCHIVADQTDKDGNQYPGGDYPAAIRKLVSDVKVIDANAKVSCVDMTALTKAKYEEIGKDGTLKLHAWTSSKDTSVDNTHLNIYGAKMVAYIFANAVKEANNTTLAASVNETLTIPTEADLVSNPNYKEVEYDGNLKDSEFFKDYVAKDSSERSATFKGTAFGNLGGAVSAGTKHILETDGEGNMHIAVKSDKGKISSGDDGIVMYYYKVPATSQIEISAKATINNFNANNQVAFGLMARDDMYIDINETGISSDYVVAGSLGTGCNCFYRKDGTLGGKASLATEKLEVGSSYNLSIKSNTDGYECVFGRETAQTGGYDFHLTSVDSDYIYIGMFASRNIDVTYSNIYLKIDDKVIVDQRSTEYSITLTNDGNGTVASNKASASKDEAVTLTATPKEGYMFKEYQITCGSETTTSTDDQYTMPEGNVTIKAVFEQIGTEWNFQTDAALNTGINALKREGGGNTTTFYVGGLHVDATNGKWDSTGTASNGWVQTNTNTVINIPVKVCDYVKVDIAAYSADYTVDYDKAALNAEDSFICEGKTGNIRLDITGNTYIRSIKVTPDYEYTPPSAEKKIEVWDFGAKEETDTDTYNNNVTKSAYDKAGIVDSNGGTFKATSPTAFGDLTMYYNSGDRLYSNIEGVPNAGSYGYAQAKYSDYEAAGGWYCNGTGGANRRYVTIANVHAGDKIVAYMGITQTSDSQFFFEGQGTASAQKDSVDAKIGEFQKYEFVAQYDGTYKIYENAAGKPMYHRIMRVPGVNVSGNIELNNSNITGYGLKFVNLTTKTETVAAVADDGSFTATLAAGFSYRAVLTGAIGYGFTTESSNNIQTTEAEALTGKTGVTLEVETKDTYSYSGKIKGFDSNYDKLSNLKITMTPPKDSDANEVELSIDKEKMEFSADLAPDVEYSLVMEGVNDYEITAPTVVVKENENTSYENRTISVALRPKYEVAGGFMGLADGTTVTSLTFTNTADNYAYTATIDDGGYSIQLRDGEYLVAATVSNYSTKTHVVVNGGAVSRDILFVSTSDKGKITYASDIYVGYPKQTNNYATVSEAVEAAGLMDRTADDAHRVTIHIAPGTYREQIIIKAPYISFVNDEPDEEVLLTWYYGIGYKYYSTASSKFYNAEDAYDKYDKNIADRWGCSVRVQSAATAFRAEGITFESSFNRYITDEELIDGVEVAGNESIKFVRAYGADVQSKEATERATALVVEADKAEFRNCGFYSSQDTLYTQGAHIYFKNCVIEGQTDYIFGSGNCIFDACELSWKGYSTGSSAGYITANRPNAGEEGYLFRNCTVTANCHNDLTVTPGYFGRPWGADAKVAFINTKLQNSSLIEAAGWYKMTGEPQDANYKEYNTTSLDGKAVVTTGRQYAVIDKTAADSLTVSKYFGSWTPAYYTADTTGTVSISGGLTIADNGDSNVPKPGHTLTVNYSLGDDDENDVSAIKWYIVEYNADGTEKTATLVKTSTAIVDKTYKITKDAVGKYIKVTVTPETLDGRTGTALSATTYDWSNGGQKCPVLEGYEDPSSESGGITLGEGVNIFLAGDSTVKDYSAAGMYNGGNAQNLGAWGEFLQSFFNESEVKIQNYANGGRSTRNFINEGSLKKIEAAIGEGDYLFIQFGHNDASNSNEDRYVPVGTPVNGIYPTEPGVLVDGKYPDYTSGGVANSAAKGTYKWFLQQYIDVAIKKGATPVVISPVSRQYYSDDGSGKIKTHHDDNTSSNNAYVTAAYQIYQDNQNNGCLWIDGFTLTKDLFEAAFEADPDASGKKSNYGLQIMGSGGDSTHNNKLGGMIEAMAIASAIQNLNVNISYAVKAPSRVRGATTDGTTVFSIDGNSKLAAYDILSDYASSAPYWEKIGQDMITAISTKSGELADSNIGDDVTAAPKAAAVTTEDADGKIKITVTLTCDTAGNTIYYTTDGSDPKKNEDKKTYSDPIVITEDTTLKAYAAATGKKDSKVVTFEYSVTPTVNKPTASEDDGSRIPAGTVITLTADDGAVIRYTQGNNPEDPTIYSRKYSNGITVSADTTIKAIAVKGGVKSEVAVFKYTVYTDTSSITVNPPQFNPEPVEGNVALNTKVRLSADDGAVIYYTQGNNPADPTTANADIYDDEEGIVISKTTTIKAIAVKSGKASTIASATYTVQTISVPETSTPEGVIDGAISITLTCDEGAEIWYTTDRSDPRKSESRTKYENPIEITATTTVKAYAVKDGYADSDVVTWVYTMKSDVVETVGFSKEPYFNLKTPHPGNTLEVKYELDKDGEDISTIKWFVGEDEITANADKKTYEVQAGDVGKVIKARVTPKVQGIKAGTYKEAVSAEVTESSGTGNGLEIILETKEYTYTGSAIIPDYSVTYDGEPLVEGIDYTVKCSNNIKVSTDKSQAKITVTGKGNLSGNTTESFKITKKSLVYEDTEGAGEVQGGMVVVVAGSKASPVLVYNGIKLGTKDYEIVGTNKDKKWNANETGIIKIKAKSSGNFTGERELDVVVVAKNNDSKIVVTLDSKKNKDLCYNGGVVRPVYSVTNKKNAKLVEDEDYIISFPEEEVTSAGKKTFTVIGISEKCVGAVTKSYTVKPALKTGTFKVELGGTDIIKNKQTVDFVSTGAVLDTNNLKVTYVVKAASGDEQAVERELNLGSDYTITYSGNKKVTDNAKFTITGQGNYKGVKIPGTYKIKAATLSLDEEGEAGTVKVIVSDKIFTKAKMYKSTPCVIEKASGTVLKASNYTVEYFDDKDGQPSTTKMTKADKAGKVVWVKITGKGGYTGTVYAPYTIKQGDAKKDLSTATISLYETSKAAKPAKTMQYTGEEVIPAMVVIKLKNGTEIKLILDKDGNITSDNSDKFDIEFFNNTAKGKASVVITSKDDATCIGSKTVNFTISAKTLKGFKWVK